MGRPRAKPRVFYGWIMVAGLMLVGFVAAGMGGPNFSLFIKPMVDDLHIGQAAFGWSQSIRLVALGLGAPFIGRLIDRFGGRWPLVGAGVLSIILFLALSQVQNAWVLILLFGGIGFIGIPEVQLYTTVPISNWFVQKRGRVLAFVFIGFPIGIMVWSPVTDILIDQFGWRGAWAFLGTFGGATLILVGLFIVRRRPEDMGLLPDGLSPQEAGLQQEAPQEVVQPVIGVVEPTVEAVLRDDEISWTRADALRHPSFWKLSVAFGLMMFSMGTLVIFRVPYFIDQGLDRGTIALGLSLGATPSVIGGIFLGFVLDRASLRYVGALGMVIMLGAGLMTMAVTQTWQMFIAVALLSSGISATIIVQNAMFPHYYGRDHIGAIRGSAMMVMLAFGAVGPPLAGQIKDSTGSFFPAWWAAIGAWAVGALLLYLTPKPTPRQTLASVA